MRILGLSTVAFVLVASIGRAPAQPISFGANYVVIGAFSVQKNAAHFVESARRSQLAASFEINRSRHLYYVYVLQTGDRQIAIEEAKKLRNQSRYSDTWVYSGILGKELPFQAGVDINPESNKLMKSVALDHPQSLTATPNYSASTQPDYTTHVAQPSPAKNEARTETTGREVAPVNEVEAAGKNFVFRVYRSLTGTSLEGDVAMTDLDQKRKLNSYKGNQPVRIAPVNKSGNVQFECTVFGYRKVTHAINFQNPAATDGVTIEEGNVVVPFELVRLKKGDVSVMYNVYFYKDASVIRPESKYEIDALLEMMRENPNYKIRIHGHTNGKSAGKIISRGDTKNYFSLQNSSEGFGSAKMLSEERAQTIEAYLADNGVAQERMKIKAWGGKKPIYDRKHAQAHTNVRVEIEILQE